MSQAPEWYGDREDADLQPLIGPAGQGGRFEYDRAMLASTLRVEALLAEILAALKARPAKTGRR